MTRRDFRFIALRRILLVGLPVAAMLAIPQARAAICKYLDQDGNVVYSNVAPTKGLRKLSCDIVENQDRGASSGNSARSTPTPEGFPRVSPEAQRSRRRDAAQDTRRRTRQRAEAARRGAGCLRQRRTAAAARREERCREIPAADRQAARGGHRTRAQRRGTPQGDRHDALNCAFEGPRKARAPASAAGGRPRARQLPPQVGDADRGCVSSLRRRTRRRPRGAGSNCWRPQCSCSTTRIASSM